MPAVVRPCLRYILLYGRRTYESRQLGLIPASRVRFAGVGFFVPEPTTVAGYQYRSLPGLGQTVRECRLASTAVGGDCY